MKKTLINLLENSASKYSENIYLWEKKDKKYEGTTYKETLHLVENFAAGLMCLGLKKGERVALISEGRNDWIVSELGVLFAGGVNVPLSVKLNEPSEISFRINHSECRYLIISRQNAHKIELVKNDIPNIEKIILIDDIDVYSENEIAKSTIDDLGRTFLKDHRGDFDAVKNSITNDDIANISYTSGTTADPKGIILTHRNYTANVEQALSLMPLHQEYRTLVILPWDHSFGHTAGLYSFMMAGASIASVKTGKTTLETLKNIPKNIKEIKPHILMSVPALAKNFKKNIESGIAAKGNFTNKLFNIALNFSYWYNRDGHDKGKGLKPITKPLSWLFDKILFSKIREVFGGQLKFFIGGGALLDIDIQRFFYAIGIPMYQGYGLSEASPIISSNSDAKHKLGSSGFLVKNMKLKIIDDKGNELPIGQKGEITIQGENVMKGYWKNAKSSEETLRDGWIHTGDMGYMDKDGYLYVLGRFKSLLIGNDGEKYSPEGIEEALIGQSIYIDQCMLYNDHNPYTVALFVPNKAALKKHLIDNNITPNSDEAKAKIIDLFKSEINKYKDGEYAGEFPERWLPSTFAILDEPFTEENKMINSTIKMVRGVITKTYKERINSLYSKEGKSIHNSENIQALKLMEV